MDILPWSFDITYEAAATPLGRTWSIGKFELGYDKSLPSNKQGAAM